MPPRASQDDNPMPINNPRAVEQLQLRALQKLNEQLATLNDHLASVNAPTAQARIEGQLQSVADRQMAAQRATNLPPRFATTQSGFIVPEGTPQPEPSTQAQAPAAKPYLPRANEVPFRQRLRQGMETHRGGAGFSQGFLEPQATRASIFGGGIAGGLAADQLDQQRATNLPPNASTGNPGSSGVTEPPNTRVPSGVIPGLTQAEVNNIQGQGFKIPQFGEWQLNDKLELARNWATTYALGQGQFNESGNWTWNQGISGAFGRGAANVAGYAQWGAQHAAQVYAMQHLAMRATDKTQGWVDIGKELGYSPQGLGGASIFGFRNIGSNITSPAGAQGRELWWQAQQMTRRPSAGFTSKQAEELLGSLAEQGWGGSNLQNIGYATAPLLRQGMSPEDIATFSNALRMGNVSLSTFTTTLKDFQAAAQAAHETTSQYNSDLEAFQQEAQQYGATQAQGQHLGLQWTAATGTSPQFATAAMSSSLVQAMALRQGILPSGLGTAGGGALTNFTQQALQMAMSATQGLNVDRYQNIGGRRVLVQSGTDAQVGQVAQLTGLPPDLVRNFLRNGPQQQAASRALSILGDSTSGTGYLGEQAPGASRGARGQGISWYDVESQAHAAGIPWETLSKLTGMDPQTRGTKLEQMLSKVAEQNTQPGSGSGNTVTAKIDFTPYAAKFFQQIFDDTGSAAKHRMNAGGPLTAGNAVLPNLGRGSGSYPVH